MGRILHGAAYYPEDWDDELLDFDIEKMKETGFNVVRIAEFAWSRMEPSEGEYDFAWLHRVVDALAEAASTPASVIRSIQTFTLSVNLDSGGTSTQGLSTVDPSKCIGIMDYWYDRTSGQSDISYTLTANSLTLQSPGGYSGEAKVHFQVVEFN